MGFDSCFARISRSKMRVSKDLQNKYRAHTETANTTVPHLYLLVPPPDRIRQQRHRNHNQKQIATGACRLRPTPNKFLNGFLCKLGSLLRDEFLTWLHAKVTLHGLCLDHSTTVGSGRKTPRLSSVDRHDES